MESFQKFKFLNKMQKLLRAFEAFRANNISSVVFLPRKTKAYIYLQTYKSHEAVQD